ncbi:MAG TPA: hypothetical protein VLM38_10930 [Blastocatellia bacterium]|nr:hypothetical protein [Blastocatellia bacterium]
MLFRFVSLVIAVASTPAMLAGAPQQPNPARSQTATQATENAQTGLPASAVTLHFGLPPGENAWGVQVLTSGGFTGAGRGDFTLTSEGRFTWSSAEGSCGRNLADSSTQTLGNMVLSISGGPGFSRSEGLGCFDCYTTDMVVQRRETGGVVKTYRVMWDDSTQGQVPSDVWRVYEALMALKGCKL